MIWAFDSAKLSFALFFAKAVTKPLFSSLNEQPGIIHFLLQHPSPVHVHDHHNLCYHHRRSVSYHAHHKADLLPSYLYVVPSRLSKVCTCVGASYLRRGKDRRELEIAEHNWRWNADTQIGLADIGHLCLVLNIASSDFKNISACVFSRASY